MADRAVQEIRTMLAEHGFGYLTDLEVLSYVLSFSMSGCPLRPARDLLAGLGGYARVLEAPVEDLRGINGVSESSALLLRLLAQFGNRYLTDRFRPRSFARLREVGEYLTALYAFETVEIIYVLCIDRRNKLIAQHDLGRGVVNSVDVSVKKILSASVRSGAAKVIISHNHPHGSAKPSDEDIATTGSIYNALGAAGIELVDHVIVSGCIYYSMERNRCLPQWSEVSRYSFRG